MAKVKEDATKNATLGFEAELWKAAEKMWGHIPAAEYRQILIGLIFLRYVSATFKSLYDELAAEGWQEDRDAYKAKNVFFVPEDARWDKIAAATHTPEIGVVLDHAMEVIEKENPTLKNILPKIYASPDIDKNVLGEVVDLFSNRVDMNDIAKDKDILGRTYEYCVREFAAYEGKKGGEFYTPASIVRTLVNVLKPEPGKRIYDPCCGSGGMFVQSIEFIKAHQAQRGTNNFAVYGQEANPDTWRMAKMNLAIRGITCDLGPSADDTFRNDIFSNKKFDYILANPPFNLKEWGQSELQEDVRWQYGIPPAGNANFAWIQHMIHHLAPNGRIGLVLANGAVSSTTGGEGEIRKALVEADLVEGIVALPTQLFYSVTIPVTLWFFNKCKQRPGETLFIDARNLGFMEDKTHRDFKPEDIARIADAFENFRNGTFENETGFAAAVTTEEIGKKDFNLVPGRYVGIVEDGGDGEPFAEKMARLTAELAGQMDESQKLDARIGEVLKAVIG